MLDVLKSTALRQAKNRMRAFPEHAPERAEARHLVAQTYERGLLAKDVEEYRIRHTSKKTYPRTGRAIGPMHFFKVEDLASV